MRAQPKNPGTGLILYQHDGVDLFRFVLIGRLEGSSVEELLHAWTTAASAILRKQVVVDLSSLKFASEAGVALLTRMRASGARIIPPASRATPDGLRDLGAAVALSTSDAS